MKQKTLILLSVVFLMLSCKAEAQNKPTLGAEQTVRYLSLLKDKKVALMVNPSSLIGNTHLVDTLLASGIKITKIFSPEHGFRGTADAGEKVNSAIDPKTGIPIVSLYGTNKKPTREQLNDVDVIIFDIQDVGVRFFTYIGSMHYLMQACADYNKKLIVLDRPNPNGYYVDGPVLDMKYKSFIGMHPVPVVHGLTVGEYAQMINGEHWLDSAKTCALTIIPMVNYNHTMTYSLPVKPSPNLPNDLAVQFYPTVCFFEGTELSVGRGTDKPFQIIGAPKKEYGSYKFTPKSTEGAKKPMYENQLCYGVDLTKLYPETGLRLRFLLEMYQKSPTKEVFFTDFFTKLAGNTILKEQIKKGLSESAIRASWQEDLTKYKAIRKKYLLYEDFK